MMEKFQYPGNLPDRLQIIKLSALSVNQCQEIYNSSLISASVHESQICSLTKWGEGACHVSYVYLFFNFT